MITKSRCLWGGGLLALFLIVLWSFSKVTDDRFASPQSYMSLVRAQQLHDTWNWYDAAIHRSNVPYGEQIASTRLFDLVLLIPALIGSVILKFSIALSTWGTILGPVLGLGILYFFTRVSKPASKSNLLAQSLILFFLLLPWFLPGKCEPSQLTILLFAALFYAMSELFKNPIGSKWPYISGGIMALAMWVQVDALVIILVVHAAFVALWFIGDMAIARIAAKQSRALLAASAIAFIIEHPYREWLHVELYKLSAGHLLVFGILAAVWSIMATFVDVGRLKRVQERLWWSFRSFLIALFILFFSFREFISTPLPVYSPEAMLYWYNPIAEKLPLASESWKVWGFLLFGVVVALGFALYQSIKSGITERRWWIFLTSGIVFFTLFAMLKDWNWLAYVLIVCFSSWSSLVRAIVLKKKSEAPRPTKRFINPDIAAFMGMPVFAAVVGLLTSILVPHITSFLPTNYSRNIKPLCGFLESHYSEDKPRRILAYIDYGPEILYRTRHEVVVIPYGNRKAIYDERAFMFAEDTDLSRLVAQERKIDTVIVTPDSQAEKEHYPAGENFPSMHRQLITGKCPPWMSLVQTTEIISKSFMVYEVSPEILRISQEPLMRAR